MVVISFIFVDMVTEKNVEKFEKWLRSRGAEIIPVTNEFELIRFKGLETGVIYKSGKTSNTYTLEAIRCFEKNKSWDGRPLRTGRKSSYKKEKIQLLKRDGDKCFYCGNKLYDDITLEHLLELAAGGKNTLANSVLAHSKCNDLVKGMTIVEKVNFAIANRIKKLNK